MSTSKGLDKLITVCPYDRILLSSDRGNLPRRTATWANVRGFALSGRSQTQEDLLSNYIYVKSADQQTRSLVAGLRIAAALE